MSPKPHFKTPFVFILALALVGLMSWLAASSSQASGTPSFASATSFSVGTSPNALAIGDFNGDSTSDLAVANSGSGNISILLGDGAAGFGTATNFSVGLTPVSIAVGDFNADNKQDLAVANSGDANNAGSISILLGDGAGSFGAATNPAAGTHPYSVAVADFNADSKPDLAVANFDSNNVSIFLGNGTGGFGAPATLSAGTNPRALVTGDFNSDTKLDLAIANQGSNNVSFAAGNGNGGFTLVTNFSVHTAPVSIATDDFNGDSKSDLVTANVGSSDASVLLGDGLGGFSGASNFAVGTNPYSVAVGDFYGDGKADLAVANSGSGNVSVLLGDGAGSFGSPTNFVVGADPRILAKGDFNIDGKPDIAVPNSGAHNVSVLVNTSVVTAIVSGTVKDSANNPIPNVLVEAINLANQQVVASGITDAMGHYELTVPLGNYNLKATPPVGSEFIPATITNLAVTADIVQDITLVKQPPVTLSGRITDRDGVGLPGISIHLNKGTLELTADTGPDGRYSRAAQPGDYQVYVAWNQSSSTPFNPTIPTSFDTANSPLTVPLTQDTTRDFKLENRVLSGHVRDSTGQPVAGASVNVNTYFSTFGGIEWRNQSGVFTDANGFYSMGLFIGTTGSINIAGSGVVQQTFPALNISSDMTQDFQLQGQLPKLSGRITDRDGVGVPGISIHLSKGTLELTADTAPDGRYSRAVQPGDYQVYVAWNQSSSTPFNPTIPTSFDTANSLINLTITQDTTRDFKLENRVLSGHVRDSTGQPVAGASVNVNTYFSTFGGIEWRNQSGVFTDANGFYSMGLFIGTTGSINIAGSGVVQQTFPALNISSDMTQDFQLQGQLPKLSGRVTDRDGVGLPGISIHLNKGTLELTADTGPDGRYSRAVQPGDYQVYVAWNQSNFTPFNPTIPTFFDTANSLLNLTITQDTTRDFKLENRVLSGHVRDSTGQPVAGASVNVNTYFSTFGGIEWRNQSGVFTDANGFYSMGLFIGTTGSINIAGSGVVQQTFPSLNITTDTTNDITIQRSVHSIRGQVIDGAGSPLTGVTVALTGTQSGISTTDGNGNYTFINLSEGGNYTVTPMRTSYQFSPANAVFNNLVADQTANFTGTLVTFSVTGQVRDGSSNGVSGVTVTLSGATTSVTQTDNSGAYAFNSVAAFTNYSVKPAKPNFSFTPSRTDISNLSANQTADFTAAAQPSPTPTPPLDEDFGNAQRNPDKFNFGSLSTDPTAFDPLVTVQQQNGHLEITPRANAFGTHYNGYTTVTAVDVSRNSPSVEVVQSASGAQTIYSLGSDLNNNFGFMVAPAGAVPSALKRSLGITTPAGGLLLIFQIRLDGQLTALSLAYDPVVHRHWRFRHDPVPNAILFETSADSLTWVERHSVMLQKTVTPMAVELSSGTSTTATNPGTAVFDNFHLGEKYSITGKVKLQNNNGLGGVLLSLSGALSRTTTTDGAGGYAFPLLDAGANYAVSPSLSGFSFTPPNQVFNALAANATADFTADPTASPTPTPTPPGHTPVGSNVTVQGNGVEITFAQVNSAGITTFNSITPASAGAMPGGYVINGSSVAFEVSTTAGYTPPLDLCFALPGVTDATAFNNLALLHNESGLLVDRTTTRDFAARKVCGRVSSLSAFAVADKITVQYTAATSNPVEHIGSVQVLVTRTGDPSIVATVNYATSDAAGSSNCNAVSTGNASARCDYATTAGTLSFAAGETSKTILIPVIDDAYAEGSESFTVTLSNAGGAVLGTPSVATVTINDNEATTGTNPINQTDFFVRLHYLDFFTREPDPGGFNFWIGTITSCGTDPQCTEVKRINASAAFYLSIEFQDTGYLVERIYKVAFGDVTGTSTFPSAHQLSVPIVRLNEFLPDTQQIGRGVVIGQPGADQLLESNKVDFIGQFVQRSRFMTAYPQNLTPAQFVDALNANAGNALSTAERDQLVNELSSGARTRAEVLRVVAEDADLRAAEFNRAFVLMQYFGYLRRNPNDAPDSDHTGYDFWLAKLNQFNGNFVNAEMVKAFIVSGEYKGRFGP